MAKKQNLEKLLQEHFGFNSFRANQKEVVSHVTKGNDSVVLMPTGGGKSICYQLPALVFDGLTVVISPLIALMKDQVQRLESNGIKAAYLNSTMKKSKERHTEARLRMGNVKLLYISPERLLSPGFTRFLKSLNMCLFAIDEAHCVSSWGHQFRPDYKRLTIIKEEFPDVPVMALTATADKAVRSDIGELLKLNDPKFFIASFDRPNLSLSVMPAKVKPEQMDKLIAKYKDQSGIIYCNSRAATEKIAHRLKAKGVKAKAYHAGLRNDRRSDIQDAFIDGHIDVIVATIAFGMGIDKADVRFVIHNNMPANLESYYQEIGRAGRDGKPADAVMFYAHNDVQKQLGFIKRTEDRNYQNIQLAKLERMQEYAEAQVCRRKILLSYFSEPIEEDCGNCDVCKNPPKYIGGTKLALTALNVVKESDENTTMTSLVDVLKGNASKVVKDKKLEKLKTFGSGKEETAFAWKQYVQQVIQQGMLEIDYKDKYKLKITKTGKEVLSGKRKKVQMVSEKTIKERQEQQKEDPQPQQKEKVEVNKKLLKELKSMRAKQARKMSKPAQAIFTDETLADMCAIMPKNLSEFMQVEGVGMHKAKLYANDYLNVISEHAGKKSKA